MTNGDCGLRKGGARAYNVDIMADVLGAFEQDVAAGAVYATLIK